MLSILSPLRTGQGLLGLVLLAATLPHRAGQLQAQAPDPLAPLVEEALRANLALEQRRLAEDEAAAALSEARGAYFPSVSLEARYSEQHGGVDLGELMTPVYAALNDLAGADHFPTSLTLPLPPAHESRLRLVQPLFHEGIRANHALAQHRREGARQERLVAARVLAAGVEAIYLRLAAARTGVRILEATLVRVEEGERVAERLVAAGAATPDALFRARADRREVEQQLLESRERAHAARRGLNRLLGRRIESPFEEFPDSLLRFELTMTREEALAHALAHREELQRAEAAIGAADAAVRVATADFLPKVSLAVEYGFQGSEPTLAPRQDFLMGSLVLSWNPFAGGRTLARRRGASTAAQRTRVLRDDLEQQVRLEVLQAYEAAVVARASVATAEERLAAARRTFDLVRRRHEEGAATQLEFVDARTALTEAELNRAATSYGYAVRCVELRRAAALRVINLEEWSER